MKNIKHQRLIIVSNRLPFVVDQNENSFILRPSSGGLVTALAAVLNKQQGLWIGWSGTFNDIDTAQMRTQWREQSSYDVHAITLTNEEHDKFYYGFANEIIWPLFHDLQSLCNFYSPDYWQAYEKVNQKFANAVLEQATIDDYIWIHDYHLMHVAKLAREKGLKSPLGFFLHIPFPPPDIFGKLPWRKEMLEALLHYDLVGFQTLRDKKNFLDCLKSFYGKIESRGSGHITEIPMPQHTVRIGTFPIGIDFDEFSIYAEDAATIEEYNLLKREMRSEQLILGIDRLDYTKGLTYKLAAFRHFLEHNPELHGKVQMIQVVVPSRENIPQYSNMKMEVERLISEINGQFTKPGWVPIHYIFRSLSRAELLGYYRAADIALVTPLKDGMNLVAKEYAAANNEEDGVLILSEFAGAACQFKTGALLVNPYNIADVATKIAKAYFMSKRERRSRMRGLRTSVKLHDVSWWVAEFLRESLFRKPLSKKQSAPKILIDNKNSSASLITLIAV